MGILLFRINNPHLKNPANIYGEIKGDHTGNGMLYDRNKERGQNEKFQIKRRNGNERYWKGCQKTEVELRRTRGHTT